MEFNALRIVSRYGHEQAVCSITGVPGHMWQFRPAMVAPMPE
jgi:hypothetical protein